MCIQRAGGCSGPGVINVNRYHSQLVPLQGPLELQLLVLPEANMTKRGLDVVGACTLLMGTMIAILERTKYLFVGLGNSQDCYF